MTITQLRRGNLVAGQKIARSLGTTEEAIDDTIVAQTKLLTAIIEGRRQAGAGVTVGHSAFRKAAAALEALAQARDLVEGCHADLADVRDYYRLRETDLGCSPDKGLPAGFMPNEAKVA